MKQALKWDFKKHKYETTEIDDECFTYCDDLNKRVPCTNCGKRLPYGRMYTSLRYHTCVGFGYPVCEACYNEEVAEENLYKGR